MLTRGWATRRESRDQGGDHVDYDRFKIRTLLRDFTREITVKLIYD